MGPQWNLEGFLDFLRDHQQICLCYMKQQLLVDPSLADICPEANGLKRPLLYAQPSWFFQHPPAFRHGTFFLAIVVLSGFSTA